MKRRAPKKSTHKGEERLFVSVKSRAKEEVTQALDATHFVVSVKAAPVDGKANEAVRRALALYLGISPSLLRLKSGAKDKHKVFLLSGLV